MRLYLLFIGADRFTFIISELRFILFFSVLHFKLLDGYSLLLSADLTELRT